MCNITLAHFKGDVCQKVDVSGSRGVKSVTYSDKKDGPRGMNHTFEHRGWREHKHARDAEDKITSLPRAVSH